MELTFNALIEHIKNGQNYFITGPAGVGKTYTIKAIYQRLKTEGVGVVLTSTTGINALNLKGITVHKLFGLTNRSDLGYLGFMKQSFLFHGIKKRLAKLQVIIIDEVSMLRADTFELINQILLQTGDPTKPFGGKTLIFTGDFYQISPVVKSWEKQQNQWLFTAPAWNNSNIKTIILNHVWRQSDPVFINFLHQIRIGKIDQHALKIIQRCVKNKLNEQTTPHFFSTRDECDTFNQKMLEQIKSETLLYDAVVTGKRNRKFAYDKESIFDFCIAKKQLQIKSGMRVIALINDPKNRFANGSLGTVIDAINQTRVCQVTVKFDDYPEPLKLKRYQWTKYNLNGKRVASVKQIPLIPAYALTIHKSQGMTLPKAIIDCKNIFACGQLYVALSRVKSLNELQLLNFHPRQLITAKVVSDYYALVKQELKDSIQLQLPHQHNLDQRE